ncbi:hypothetical protein [Ruania halotolerans]|uniref:hypothetical protein n=1 Tax=Ruania halotolerans TaxID=2897773 RepID=UPI001E45C60C|nr:hypothetical protein [Ruania halotolerans]UFU07312.1 hypothetical protein LQF10_04160 [Ruania halotolerans]
MTQRARWLRRVHRGHAGLTLAMVIALLALNLAGVLPGSTAWRLFLTIEIPLLLVLVFITAFRLNHVARTKSETNAGFLDRLASEEPLLRGAVAELRAFASLFLLASGKRRVTADARPFGYTRGTMTFPAVMIAVSLVELVVVHFLVPWPWLQIVLIILTIWSVLFVLGHLASRVVHPHFVKEGALHLRWGHSTVLVTPLTNILVAKQHANHAHTQPHIDDEQLILTAFQSTNVLIKFSEPVRAAAPIPPRHLPADFHASEVQLHIDEPDSFLAALGHVPDSTTT